jgi:D-alanyl-lipoteichoic acid acyltransferase DltB (MBOAT superfamily)
VLLAYWGLVEKFRTPILLISSYIFYSFWDWRFSILLAGLTLSNFWLTQVLHRTENRSDKKRVLIACLLINLSVLGFFKYFGFFTQGLVNLLESVGFSANAPTLKILLPLGLSFFIFQVSSYVIDVYRGDLNPEESLVNFGTFVVYFPHMAAGPIMPAKILIPQIVAKKIKPDFEQIQSAFFLITLGLFRKIVIADTLAPMVNRVLDNPDTFSWQSLLIASVGFGLQIYGDFAGYSAIARGVSRLFGIEMMVNFTQPYLASSITDFWRRWHISLSSWFRDYLYIPLGGNKKGRIRTNVNLLIVMLIAGLWHGAAIGFIFWGLLHGLYLIIDKSFTPLKVKLRPWVPMFPVWGWLMTQGFVFFAWIFFRNPAMAESMHLLYRIINRGVGIFEISDALLLFAVLCTSFFLDVAERNSAKLIQKSNTLINGLVIGVFLTVAFTLKSSTVVPFIYFEF